MIRPLIPARWQSPPIAQVSNNVGAVEMAAVTGAAVAVQSDGPVQLVNDTVGFYARGVEFWQEEIPGQFQEAMANPGPALEMVGILGAAYLSMVLLTAARNVYFHMRLNGDSFGGAMRKVASSFTRWP